MRPAPQSGAKSYLFRHTGYSVFSSTIIGLVSLFAVGGALERTHRSLIFVVFLSLLALVLIGRSWHIGILISSNRVVHRQWFHQRSYDLADMEDVRTRNYSGAWNFYSQSTVFSMIVITIDNVDIDVPEVSGRPQHLRRVATQMRELVHLPDNR